MFCRNCGTQCPDGTKFCPSCGCTFDNDQPTENVQQNFSQPDYSQHNDYAQQNYTQPNYTQPNYTQPNNYTQPPIYNAPLGMNWFKFLIYFGLFAGAVINCISAILQVTGVPYKGLSEYVYMFFPALRFLDIFYCISALALAAFQIYTRFQLASFRKNAPKLVLIVYSAAAVISLIYIIAASIILHEFLLNAYIVIQIVVPCLMVVLNKVYFDKRKDMFVN